MISVGRSVKNLHVNEDFNEINETLLADLVYGRYNLFLCFGKLYKTN